jgi:hypothetical protein
LVLINTNFTEHDWHHEKFTQNYSLSFKYLDRLFGTYHVGRVPGEQFRTDTGYGGPLDTGKDAAKDTRKGTTADTAAHPTAPSPAAPPLTAQYKQLKDATVLDFEVQGKAFDAYAEAGNAVRWTV